MSHKLDSKRIQTAANLYFGDGLLDIALGVGLIMAGFLMIINQMALAGIYIVLLVPLIQMIKTSVIAPRLASMGITETEETKQRRKQFIVTGFLALTFLLGLLTFLFFVVGAMTRPSWFMQYAGVGLVGLGVGLMALTAWITEAKRFFVYAGLVALVFVASDWLNLGVPLALMGLGLIILLSGLEVLRRFVFRYPKVGP